MMSSIASISSSSSATVRVEKATSEFLIGPDWTMNIDICDTINSNQMLAKDVVKALKKRLQHKNPKVQLLALTLLETMVKNCGDYLHFLIAERNILPEMVKIVKKKTDMHVRDKILTLIGSWHEAFGGHGGKYPQYYMAYEDLRRFGVEFPRRSPDAAPIFTPPVTHPISRQPQPSYGTPSSSSTRLDEAMAAEENLSLSSINSMRDVMDLLTDMLQAVDPSDRLAVKDEVIVDLVEQCRANQRKLMQMLSTTGDEELLVQGLELNDSLQILLSKHDAIASGSPLPPQLTNLKIESSEQHGSVVTKPAEIRVPNETPNANYTSAAPVNRGLIDEQEEEEDDFTKLAQRHSRTRIDPCHITSVDNGSPLKKPIHDLESSPVTSNALVPVTLPSPPLRTQDQDIIDLLSITLSTTPTSEDNPGLASTEQTSHNSTPITHQENTHSGNNPGLATPSYIAPWAQPQPPPRYVPQQVVQSPYATTQTQFPQYSSAYPPPPWAATPGYFNNSNTTTYTLTRPATSSFTTTTTATTTTNNNSNSNDTLPSNVGQKPPFIPSYRLFEDLDVFGNSDGGFKATSHAPNTLTGSNNNQSMMGGGRK